MYVKSMWGACVLWAHVCVCDVCVMMSYGAHVLG